MKRILNNNTNDKREGIQMAKEFLSIIPYNEGI